MRREGKTPSSSGLVHRGCAAHARPAEKLLPVPEAEKRVSLDSKPFPKRPAIPASDGTQLQQAWPSDDSVLAPSERVD